MQAAIWPREQPQENRMMVIETKSATISDHTVRDLASFLRGDVLVVNDAATLPASLRGALMSGAEVELRLLQHKSEGRFVAVLFGAGSWRQKTEERPAPPRVFRGDVLRLGERLSATVEGVDPGAARLIEVRFHQEGAALYQALYQHGRPVQYSYMQRELALWHVQNAYAGRPWSMELPSAGHSLTLQSLLALKEAGVSLSYLTHAAGLSSTGDEALDARLPLPERYDIPRETVDEIHEAKRDGRRIIAVGTSVTRALESSYLAHGALRAGEGVAGLIIREGFVRRVVDGLFTGMHAPQESHYDLLLSFAPGELLRRAYERAERQEYLGHEFGDTTLIL